MGEKVDNIEETLPWTFTGAVAGLPFDGCLNPYAMGAIVSEKLGCPVIALTYDGPDQDENIEKVNCAARFIIEKCNGG